MPSRTIRILSYNVHSCVGTDRKRDPARIADVIAETGADIIGLQELDVGRRRSGGIDQAQAIANHLRMDFHFHPALRVAEEQYGDAILTALPLQLRQAGGLTSVGEPRGALWADVEAHGERLHIVNTHLGLTRRDRVRQMRELLGRSWLGNSEIRKGKSLLIGDFNSIPSSAPYRMVKRHMKDVVQDLGELAGATFPSRWPLLRLDHIFVSESLRLRSVEAVRTPLARLASDHLPLLAEVAF
ncbi:endonuclease/exonuclease/phosphatase family protein [Rhizobium oryzicola]|uniref:Endonuclease/exonuclease/phosphatase family protein n=1 Tax=Rhizobium oryzicola TaxID=1232668 RepID=A0ABT8T262_9HYPH|nr:endonuclease/exonuclease/phosphatase family protein [Rhizobium oryzicola]MDO1584228.1 endonuclease/exonuclease/phosphatase family protein [Rhizobium oryzicola]